MTRDEYVAMLIDMQAKYEALGKAMDAMRQALWAGCFTDPWPSATTAQVSAEFPPNDRSADVGALCADPEAGK